MAASELADNSAGELRGDDHAGPLTHLDNFEDVSTNVSEFAQVIFHGVQECYVPGNDVICNYSLTPAIKPQSRDWIGVFKVGWTSTRQYRAFEWAPCPADWTEGQDYYQEITFKAYYLPKDEDGEYYQLCYIDSTGKMRGASTPFQFLEQSADDFVQIVDESMDILMIHNKTEFFPEELQRVQEEKRQIEQECFSLTDKVATMETELKEAREQLERVTKEYEERSTKTDNLEEEVRSMATQLSEAQQKVSQLSEEAGNYERSLQQTEGAFMEVVTRELAMRNKLDELEKKQAALQAERDNIKTKEEASEKSRLEMYEEIDKLKQRLCDSHQTTQTVKESEVRMKEQYQKIQLELQRAASDKENYEILESRLASAEETRTYLVKELESQKMVREKLSRDLVAAKTEKESLKVAKERQIKEFGEERRKMQLQAHQSREKQALLQEQISALKDGIQQLAQEKEMASKGTKGSLEANHIATKDLKDKVRRAQFQCKEEVRRRGELQKKLIAMETAHRDEKGELQREVEDLKLRLQMAAEEYKKVYTECRQLEAKLERRKVPKMSTQAAWKDTIKDMGSILENPTESNVSSTQTAELVQSTQATQAVTELTTQSVQAKAELTTKSSQAFSPPAAQSSLGVQASSGPAVASVVEEKSTQSGLPAVAVQGEGALQRAPSRDDTFDLKEMSSQMCELARELEERKKAEGRNLQLYQEEKEKRLNSERIWLLKLESLEGKNRELQEKHNKLLNDYTNMKHSYESIKFDMDSQNSSSSMTDSNEITDHARHTQFPNPYAQPSAPPSSGGVVGGMQTRFGNPYASPEAGENRNAEQLFGMSMGSVNLNSICYPPDMEDAVLSDACDSIPPSRLPEPLQPDVLPEGKIAAIKMVSSQVEGRLGEGAMVQQEHTDDEREDAQFVDAQEFPEEGNTPEVDLYSPDSAPPTTPPMVTSEGTPVDVAPSAPELPPNPFHPLEPKKCPECVIEFPPTYPEEDFVKHVQRHFAKLCPVCHGLLDPQISQLDFQRHVEDCLNKSA
ncbi:uncharacterized protein [Diadema antillarum]|uniref:uncharacterized protein n=1 Tax=Diadema antillarum TaxID=105358 RepID=UPI003A8B637A